LSDSLRISYYIAIRAVSRACVSGICQSSRSIFVSSMNDPLHHIRWRLWRVRTNTERIDDLCTAFIQSDFYQLRYEMDKQGRFVLKFGEISPLPDEIAILIGETAYLLRSTLDHLMFILARPASSREEANVEFPIVSSRKNFSKTGYKMPGVARGVRSTVERVQPYHVRKWPETQVLGQLRELNNWDKHRLPPLHIFSFDASEVAFRIDGPQGEIVGHQAFRGDAKEGKTIARAKPTGYWIAGTRVYPDLSMSFAPVFDKSMPRHLRNVHPLDVLGGAGEFIEYKVLPLFERFL